jgi:hypothetical protein
LEYFVVIWYIFFCFGISDQEKSGSPVPNKKLNFFANQILFLLFFRNKPKTESQTFNRSNSFDKIALKSLKTRTRRVLRGENAVVLRGLDLPDDGVGELGALGPGADSTNQSR